MKDQTQILLEQEYQKILENSGAIVPISQTDPRDKLVDQLSYLILMFVNQGKLSEGLAPRNIAGVVSRLLEPIDDYVLSARDEGIADGQRMQADYP